MTTPAEIRVALADVDAAVRKMEGEVARRDTGVSSAAWTPSVEAARSAVSRLAAVVDDVASVDPPRGT